MSESIPVNTVTVSKRPSLVKTIVLTGLLVGSLDIITALTDYYISTGKDPVIVLKYVASGAFGKRAFAGGTGMALAGLFFHFVIAFSFTVFFFWIYPKLSFLAKSRILTAIGYGIFMWVITNLIIIPLSSTPPGTFTTFKVIKSASILIVMLGIPLSFIAYNYYHRRTK
jgi:hypothetical protein